MESLRLIEIFLAGKFSLDAAAVRVIVIKIDRV
jgi:hypothetical protein